MKRDKEEKEKNKSGYQNNSFQNQTFVLLKVVRCLKNAPIVDYKNIKPLERYVRYRKILPSRITSVSQSKQRLLSSEIKKAKILGLI